MYQVINPQDRLQHERYMTGPEMIVILFRGGGGTVLGIT